MKALLVKKNIIVKKTHSLDILLNEIIKEYPSFSVLADDILYVHKYLPWLRYPAGEIVVTEDAKAVQNSFLKIHTFIQKLLEE